MSQLFQFMGVLVFHHFTLINRVSIDAKENGLYASPGKILVSEFFPVHES